MTSNMYITVWKANYFIAKERNGFLQFVFGGFIVGCNLLYSMFWPKKSAECRREPLSCFFRCNRISGWVDGQQFLKNLEAEKSTVTSFRDGISRKLISKPVFNLDPSKT